MLKQVIHAAGNKEIDVTIHLHEGGLKRFLHLFTTALANGGVKVRNRYFKDSPAGPFVCVTVYDDDKNEVSIYTHDGTEEELYELVDIVYIVAEPYNVEFEKEDDE